MFWALDEQGNRIYASKHTDKGICYHCPICDGDVRLKVGSINLPHFAHINRCVDDWDYEPMSEWHAAWQNLFPKGNREVVVTHPETGEKHRADVGAYQTVIEFQHSSISETEFWRRNDFYTSAGYKVVWIFDMTDLTGNSVWDNSGRLRLEREWQRSGGSGGKYRWKNPWRFLRAFIPQDEKQIDIFICLSSLGDNPKGKYADACIEKITWVNQNADPVWGQFWTSYNIGNYYELKNWLEERYNKLINP